MFIFPRKHISFLSQKYVVSSAHNRDHYVAQRANNFDRMIYIFDKIANMRNSESQNTDNMKTLAAFLLPGMSGVYLVVSEENTIFKMVNATSYTK